MKLIIMAMLLIFGYSGSGWAVCKTTGISYSHNSDVTVDELFPVSQQHISTITVKFSGIKCDSVNDTVSYIAMMKDNDIGPFSNGQKLKLTVSVPKASEKVGTTDTTEKTLVYTVTLKPGASGVAGSGGESVYVPGVLVANTGGNSNILINLVLSFCKSASWSGCVNYITSNLNGDSYVENLTVTYRPKQTTCKPDDLTLTLPDISLSELPSSGTAAVKSGAAEINLQCSDFVGTSRQSTRGMAVYLYSADLYNGSRSILKDSSTNGVGFVLESGNKPVTLSTVKGAKDGAGSLWQAKKGDVFSSQNVRIPLKASYYVYDAKKVQPGALQATALIFVNYE